MAKKIEVQIVGDASSLQRALNQASGGTSRFGSALGNLAKMGVLAAGAAGVGALAVTLRQGIKEYTEASQVAAQTNAVIKSTGSIANVTAKDVDKLAESMMKKSGVDDEAIKTGENMILTFKNIRNEAGAGNNIFDQTTQAVLDMDTAMTQGNVTAESMAKTSIRVGKALNDPIKGVSALARVGVTFSEGQKEQIKAMVESGNVMGAQKMILKELTSEFGGSAEAIGKTMPKQLNVLKESFNNFAGDLVAKAVPAVQQFVNFINTRLIPAEGFVATLKVAWQGITEVAADLGARLGTAISAVNWTDVGTSIGTAIRNAIISAGPGVTEGARGLVDKINEGIKNGNWNAIGQTMGQNLREQIRTSLNQSNAETQSLSSRIVETIRSNLSKVPGLGVLMRIPTGTLTASFSAALQATVGFFGGLLGITSANIRKFIVTVGTGFQQAVAAVRATIGQFGAAAAAIGRAIMEGVGAGILGLVPSIVSKAAGAIHSIVDGMKKAAHIDSPSKLTEEEVGKPLGQGVLEGWIKSTATLPEKMSASLKAAIEHARKTIEAARDRLGTAFDGLTSRILRAFDAESAGFETTHEKILREIDERRQMEDLVQRQVDAQLRLNEAIKEGDQAAIAAAQRDLTRATEDIARVDIEAKAAEERKNLDSLREEQRIHLEKKLAALEASFVKEGASVKKAMAAMAKLMASFGIDFESAGALVGEAFVAGLRASLGAAASAAAGVGRAVPGPSSFSPGPVAAAAGGGNTTIVFPNYIGNERDLEQALVAANARVRARGGLA